MSPTSAPSAPSTCRPRAARIEEQQPTFDVTDPAGFEVLVPRRAGWGPSWVVLAWVAWVVFGFVAVVPVPPELPPLGSCATVAYQAPGQGLLWRYLPNGRPVFGAQEERVDCLEIAELPTPAELERFYAIRRAHLAEVETEAPRHVAAPAWRGRERAEEVAHLQALSPYDAMVLREALEQWAMWPNPEHLEPAEVEGPGTPSEVAPPMEEWRDGKRRDRGILSADEAAGWADHLERVHEAIEAYPAMAAARPAEIRSAVVQNRVLWAGKLVLALFLVVLTRWVMRRPDALLIRRQGAILEVGGARYLLAEGWRATPDLEAVLLQRDRELVWIPLDHPEAPDAAALSEAINAGAPALGVDEAAGELEKLLSRRGSGSD